MIPPQLLLTRRITGRYNGLPRFGDIVLSETPDGLRAYRDRPRHPWEEPEEVEFPRNDLETIAAWRKDHLPDADNDRILSVDLDAEAPSVRAVVGPKTFQALKYDLAVRRDRREDSLLYKGARKFLRLVYLNLKAGKPLNQTTMAPWLALMDAALATGEFDDGQ